MYVFLFAPVSYAYNRVYINISSLICNINLVIHIANKEIRVIHSFIHIIHRMNIHKTLTCDDIKQICLKHSIISGRPIAYLQSYVI